ncbi:uracil-DNA glycosylase family protein [Geminocystis sp. CENA526]|uniref:uracil-DNA glycosylase family protein n=1 Tax=Geminocystis sp. CENA526 TaxID=1355871 RepID=UPI003D6F95C8
MQTIEKLIDDIQKEAQKKEFPLDIPVYESVEKEPTKPILYFGNLKSNICFFGRDLGRDEVIAGQPLIGASGTIVRKIFYETIYGEETENKEKLQRIKDRLILTNTVPYKPPENKAYGIRVKNRFRPFLEQFFVFHWQGNQIITLGTEAFKWFEHYSTKEEFNAFWEQGDRRYQKHIQITLTATDETGEIHQKPMTIFPLPHPSPLNQKYYNLFPAMLRYTLSQIEF